MKDIRGGREMAQGLPFNLEELHTAAAQADASQAVVRSVHEAHQEDAQRVDMLGFQIRTAIAETPDLDDFEKAGWSQAFRPEAVGKEVEVARTVTDRLRQLDDIFRQPGTPVLVYRECKDPSPTDTELSVTSGEGLSISVSQRLSVDVQPKIDPTNRFTNVIWGFSIPDLLRANVTIEDVQEINLRTFNKQSLKPAEESKNFMLIGLDPLVAWAERLVLEGETLGHEDFARNFVKQLWREAKMCGIALEDHSEHVRAFVDSLRDESITRHALSLIKYVRSVEPVDFRVNEEGQELGITIQDVIKAAQNIHEQQMGVVTARLNGFSQRLEAETSEAEEATL
jgi:hypothetical protein